MSLALTLLTAQSIIAPDTPLSEIERIVSTFFDPPPGQMLVLSKQNLSAEIKNPLQIQGEFWAKPPAGKCFWVRFNDDRSDRKICKKELLRWKLGDLDEAGSFQLQVIAGSVDQGTTLTWPTPYRIASLKPLGAKAEDEEQLIPLVRCEASLEKQMGDDKLPLQRRIRFELINGRHWVLKLPDLDTPLNREASRAEPYIFHVTGRNTYITPSAALVETGIPQGTRGLCRYQFSGARRDSQSGALECFENDSTEMIHLHLPCFSQLEARPAELKPPTEEKK